MKFDLFVGYTTKQILFVELPMSEKESAILNPKSVTAGQFEFTSIRLSSSEGQFISSYAKEHVYGALQFELRIVFYNLLNFKQKEVLSLYSLDVMMFILVDLF